MLNLINDAGWPIWLLILCSFFSFALIIERSLSLRRHNVIPIKIPNEVISSYRLGKFPRDLINRLEKGSHLEKLIAVALRCRHLSHTEAKERIEEAGKIIYHQLNHYLPALAAITTLAPLLGLFGTIVGMIEIFGSQNNSGANPVELAHGISVALYNTGFGLIIAIISTIFYRYFRSTVDDLAVEMEQFLHRLLDSAYLSTKVEESA